MLNAEKIEDLLNVPIKCEEGRLMRLMSCDNFIKTIFIYHTFDTLVNVSFDARLKASILKFSEMVNDILCNKCSEDEKRILGINNVTITPTVEIIKNAMLELQNWHDILNDILEAADISTFESRVNDLSMINYVVIANFCGITDYCKSINNSRILRRFMNFQNQTKQLSKGCIPIATYLKEVNNHKVYLESMYKIYTDFELTYADFLTFMLLFDIRKNRNMLNKKH